jgi:hypothetical protein
LRVLRSVLETVAEVMARRTPIRRTPLKRKPRRYVVPPEALAYWEWIRSQPCVVCALLDLVLRGRRSIQCQPTEVAHVGPRGLSQKCDPFEVIPLCTRHHGRGFPYSHHTLGKRFWEFHELDRMELIRSFKERYFSLIGIAAAPAPESVRLGGRL